MESRGVLRFSVFELDLERGELRKSGRRVALQQQPWRVLVLLASQPGRLVTRDALRQALWPEGLHVDFERGINFCVNQVRSALGDPARASHFIETVPRQGYRFVADVHGVESADPDRSVPLEPGAARVALSASATAAPARPRWWLLAACLAALAAAGGDASREPIALPPAQGLAQANAQAALARVLLEQSQLGVRRADDTMPRARAAALAALREDPRNADARVSLALVKLHYDWDWDAEQDVERALELDPRSARAHLARAACLSARGAHDAAIAAARRATELEPMCPTLRGDVGWYYYCARRFDEAAAQWRLSLAVIGDGGPRDRLVDALRHEGRTGDAWREAEATMRRAGVPDRSIVALARQGADSALRSFLSGSASFQEAHGASPVRRAALHAAAGEVDEALDLLERAARERTWGLVSTLAADPDLARLAPHPRYLRLLRETGLHPTLRAGSGIVARPEIGS
jgi:DNA-binding winged helix-turn-helix (wHTH) protein/tetratricopeptide (TPR) repeat protein